MRSGCAPHSARRSTCFCRRRSARSPRRWASWCAAGWVAAVLEQLVAPVVRGVHSADPDELPLDRAAPGLRSALLREGSLSHAVASLRERSPAGSQVAGIRGGVVVLVDRLLADLARFGVAGAARGHGRRGRRPIGCEPTASCCAARCWSRLPASPPSTAPGRRITLVTLVVDQPELAAAPRGTGVLVELGAPGVAARALTHLTAKWPWLAERAGGLQALRLSYDGELAGGAADRRQSRHRRRHAARPPGSPTSRCRRA